MLGGSGLGLAGLVLVALLFEWELAVALLVGLALLGFLAQEFWSGW